MLLIKMHRLGLWFRPGFGVGAPNRGICFKVIWNLLFAENPACRGTFCDAAWSGWAWVFSEPVRPQPTLLQVTFSDFTGLVDTAIEAFASDRFEDGCFSGH